MAAELFWLEPNFWGFKVITKIVVNLSYKVGHNFTWSIFTFYPEMSLSGFMTVYEHLWFFARLKSQPETSLYI